MAPQEPYQPPARRVSLRNGQPILRKLVVDGSMDTAEVLGGLRAAKQKMGQLQQLVLEEVDLGMAHGAVCAGLLDLLQALVANRLLRGDAPSSSSQRRRKGSSGGLDKLHLEFCKGPVDLILTSALLLDSVHHIFWASDDEDHQSQSLLRVGATLRINTSLKSLWLLLRVSLPCAQALGEALIINDTLEKLSLSGCHWTDAPTNEKDDLEGREDQRTSSKASPELMVLLEGDEEDEVDEEPSVDPLPQASRRPEPPSQDRLVVPRALADGLRQNLGLRKLDLSCASLHDEAASILVRSLVGHQALEDLDLSKNHCKDQTILALGELIGHPDSQLTTLDFSQQFKRKKRVSQKAPKPPGRPLQLTPLAQALLNNHTLQDLKLSHNRLTDAHIVEVCRNLQGNATLQHLDLQWNEITSKGLKVLTKGLSELPALRTLLLGGNAFGKEGNQMLAQLEDDDDSVCTILEDQDDDDDDDDSDEDYSQEDSSSESSSDESDTYHSAQQQQQVPSPSKSSKTNPFMGGLTGISPR